MENKSTASVSIPPQVWIEHLEALCTLMKHEAELEHYPLLLAHLQLCVNIIVHPVSVLTEAFLNTFLPQFKSWCITLDQKAHEYYFRHFLNQQFANVLYEGLKNKLSPEEQHALNMEAFFDELLHETLDCASGSVHLPYFYQQKEWGFQYFFDKEEEARFNPLKDHYGKKTHALAHQLERNRYVVLSETVIAYWMTLAKQSPLTFQTSDKRPLITLAEGLWGALLTDPKKQQRCWSPLLIVQQLLSEAMQDSENLLKDKKASQILQKTAFGLALTCHQLSHQLYLQTSDAQLIQSLKKVLDSAQHCPPLPIVEDCPLFDFKVRQDQLKQSREVFQQEKGPVYKNTASHPVFKAQKTHTAQVLDLLKTIVNQATHALGTAPAQVAFCVLGSTSRQDRRPYSDVEFLVLYTPLPHAKRDWVEFYVFQLISLVDMHIIALGETHQDKNPNAGFHVDRSHHVFAKDLWGTPEHIAQHFVTELTQNWDEPGHPWLSDESFYALLQPFLISTRPESEHVFERYQTKIRLFLSETVTGMSFALSAFKEEDVHTLKQWLGDMVPNIKAMLIKNQSYQTIALTQPDIDTLKKALLALNSEEATALALKLMPDRNRAYVLIQESGLSLIGLQHHQAIAWACLQDVVQKSVKALNTLQPGAPIDIKQVYYKPITYLALNLKLFYQLEAIHPSDIFHTISQTYSWGGDLIGTLFIQALAFITEHQVDLHLNKGYQEEELIYAESWDSTEETLRWAGFDLIAQGIILPLGNLLSNPKTYADLKHLGYPLLSFYLAEREMWFKRWKHKGIQWESLLTYSLIMPLDTTPATNGWSPYYERQMTQLLQHVFTLTRLQPSACRIEGLPSRHPLYLHESLIPHCFNAKGEFQGTKAYSGKTSRVCRIEGQGQAFYLKLKEGNAQGLMGRESAVQTLHLLLGGPCQVALGWPLKLTYAHKGIEKTYDVWLSREVLGHALGEVMVKEPHRLTVDALDAESYTQQFLLAYLTCTEDGQPANFIVQSTTENLSRLISIDLGQSFVNTHHLEKSRDVLSVKTMMYLLENMDAPLSSIVLDRVRLLSSAAWFKEWENAIQQMNQLFKPLLEKGLHATKVPKKDWNQYNQLIDLSESAKHCVRKRFEMLQRWLLSLSHPPTGWQLLERLDPLVALSYRSLKGKIKTPEDFYQIDPKAYVKDPATGKMYSSVPFQQIQVQTLTPEQIQRTFNLRGTYFEAIDFGNLDAAQQRFTLALLKATAQHQGSSFQRLHLSGCTQLTEEGLLRLLEQMSHLQELHLEQTSLQKDIETLELLWTLFSHRYQYRGFLWREYQVLCPALTTLHITLTGKKVMLRIQLDANRRRGLTERSQQVREQRQSALNTLLQALQDNDDETLRRAAAGALGQLGQDSPHVLDALRQALKDNNEYVRIAAAGALGQLGQDSPIILDILRQALKDKDGDVRKAAARALGQLNQDSPHVLDALLQALKDKDEDVRVAAARALGQLKKANPTVLNILLQALKDNGDVRKAAARALGQLGQDSPHVLDALLQALKDKDEDVRVAAARALGKLKKVSPMVLQVLHQAFKDGGRLRVVAAAGVLGQLGQDSPMILQALRQALKDYNEYVRITAARALGKLQDSPMVLQVLRQALKDKDGDVRVAAAHALGKLGQDSPMVLQVLRQALKDNRWLVGVPAAHALGKLYSPSAQLALLKKWIIDKTYVPAMSQTFTRYITQRIFFFACEDKHTAQALPCVSQDWKHLYEEWIETKNLEAHLCLFTPHIAPEAEKTESKEIQESGFERFMPK